MHESLPTDRVSFETIDVRDDALLPGPRIMPALARVNTARLRMARSGRCPVDRNRVRGTGFLLSENVHVMAAGPAVFQRSGPQSFYPP